VRPVRNFRGQDTGGHHATRHIIGSSKGSTWCKKVADPSAPAVKQKMQGDDGDDWWLQSAPKANLFSEDDSNSQKVFICRIRGYFSKKLKCHKTKIKN